MKVDSPVTLPDMTAVWEKQLAAVEAGALDLSEFMAGISQTTRGLVEQGKAQGSVALTDVPKPAGKAGKKASKPAVQPPCPGADCDGRLRRIKGSNGFFWGCTNYKGGCRETRPDSRGKPGRAMKAKSKSASSDRKASPPANVGEKCPECKKGTIQLKALKTGKNKGTPFKGCTNFPQCKYFAWPEHDQTEADTA